MELTKIRNLSDEELKHQETTSSEQLFRIRFQVALGQNDGVKKLRQLRKEIAQIKTVARERELGIHTESRGRRSRHAEREQACEGQRSGGSESCEGARRPHAAKPKAKSAKKAASKSGSAAKAKAGKTKKAAPNSGAKKKTGKAKGASK